MSTLNIWGVISTLTEQDFGSILLGFGMGGDDHDGQTAHSYCNTKQNFAKTFAKNVSINQE